MFWKKWKTEKSQSGKVSEGLTSLEHAEAPVRRALIAVCEKCGRKLAADKDAKDTPSTELRKALKEKCAAVYGKGQVRPVTSSCLDICPKDRVAVGILPLPGGSGEACFFTADPADLEKVSADVMAAFERMR